MDEHDLDSHLWAEVIAHQSDEQTLPRPIAHYLDVDGHCDIRCSGVRVDAAMLRQIGNDGAGRVRRRFIVDGDREGEVRLGVVLELDVCHVP